jgi:stage II sporulation protein AA (anti-sigma F factor antagonist)
MQKLTLNITDYPDLPNTKLVYFEGDFDGYAAETITALQTEIDQAVPGNTLIFDFSKLNYLNSYAIGQLVSWHNMMNSKQGKIVIVSINKNIQDIFSVLGIGSVFSTYADLEELKKGQA